MTAPPGLTYAELEEHLEELEEELGKKLTPFLAGALDDEISQGRVRLEGEHYVVVIEAFPPEQVAAFMAMAAEPAATAPSAIALAPPVAPDSNGELEEEAQQALADELEALLAGEPSGLPTDRAAKELSRRRTDVLYTFQAEARFQRVGRTRGSRWRLASQRDPQGHRDGMGRNLSPLPDLALGHLLLARLEAAEAEVTNLRAQLAALKDSAR